MSIFTGEIILHMDLNAPFIIHLNESFSDFFKEDVSLKDFSRIIGGDINQAYVLETTRGKFFLKLNSALFGHDFFEKEARGLATLANAGPLKVPRPLFDNKFRQQICLVMEFLENGSTAEDFWNHFGRSMAALHRQEAPQFGLDYNNYIGKLRQCNVQHATWASFFREERIMPLVNRAFKHKMLRTEDVDTAEKICARFTSLIPEEKPALLHGDLWKGNFSVYKDGHAAIFDPAIYYGHREMDIAMSKLFGGFDEKFYQAYQEVYPLQPGYEERTELFQLYPLLVHLLLFGGHYHQSITAILEKYQ